MYVYEVKEYEILKKAKTADPNTVVIDELTDFFVRRVQGLGLIRELFLPFLEELKNLKKKFKGKGHVEIIDFLKLKTKNVYKLIHVGAIEWYKNSTSTSQVGHLL